MAPKGRRWRPERGVAAPLCLPPSSGRNMAASAESMGATTVTGCQELDEVHAGSIFALNLASGVAVQTAPVDGGLFWEQKALLYSLHFYALAYDEQTGKEVEVGSAGHGIE